MGGFAKVLVLGLCKASTSFARPSGGSPKPTKSNKLETKRSRNASFNLVKLQAGSGPEPFPNEAISLYGTATYLHSSWIATPWQ